MRVTIYVPPAKMYSNPGPHAIQEEEKDEAMPENNTNIMLRIELLARFYQDASFLAGCS